MYAVLTRASQDYHEARTRHLFTRATINDLVESGQLPSTKLASCKHLLYTMLADRAAPKNVADLCLREV